MSGDFDGFLLLAEIKNIFIHQRRIKAQLRRVWGKGQETLHLQQEGHDRGVGETDPVGYFGAERRVSQQSSAERRREDGRQMGGEKERGEKCRVELSSEFRGLFSHQGDVTTCVRLAVGQPRPLSTTEEALRNRDGATDSGGASW